MKGLGPALKYINNFLEMLFFVSAIAGSLAVVVALFYFPLVYKNRSNEVQGTKEAFVVEQKNSESQTTTNVLGSYNYSYREGCTSSLNDLSITLWNGDYLTIGYCAGDIPNAGNPHDPYTVSVTNYPTNFEITGLTSPGELIFFYNNYPYDNKMFLEVNGTSYDCYDYSETYGNWRIIKTGITVGNAQNVELRIYYKDASGDHYYPGWVTPDSYNICHGFFLDNVKCPHMGGGGNDYVCEIKEDVSDNINNLASYINAKPDGGLAYSTTCWGDNDWEGPAPASHWDFNDFMVGIGVLYPAAPPTNPWLMTGLGDTYASGGYNGMEMRNKESFPDLVPIGTGQADFSSYIVSQAAGSLPDPASWAGYELVDYTDSNTVSGMYDTLLSLAQGNDECAFSTGVTSLSACTTSNIYFIENGTSLVINANWGNSAANVACVVVSKDNIYIDGGASDLNALFLTEGQFSTSNTSNLLTIHGSVLANSVYFQRAIANSSANPSEAIIYDAKYLGLLKSCFGERYPVKIREYGFAKPAQ